jgi:hypothetical protein
MLCIQRTGAANLVCEFAQIHSLKPAPLPRLCKFAQINTCKLADANLVNQIHHTLIDMYKKTPSLLPNMDMIHLLLFLVFFNLMRKKISQVQIRGRFSAGVEKTKKQAL